MEVNYFTILYWFCLKVLLPAARFISRKKKVPMYNRIVVKNRLMVMHIRITTDKFQIGKGVRQGCILLPCLFSFYAEYIMRNARLDEAQAGIKMARVIPITSDMQITPPLWQKVEKN